MSDSWKNDGAKRSGGDGTSPARAPTTAADAEFTREKARHTDLNAGNGRSILVVEDHADTRRALSRTLERRGFHVTTADSVSTACEQYRKSHPDLMLCDIGLPDGTGWDLMNLLRCRGNVRAIAMSGYGMDRDVQKSRDAGFLTHLIKPIDFPKLEQTIVDSLTPAGNPKGSCGDSGKVKK